MYNYNQYVETYPQYFNYDGKYKKIDNLVLTGNEKTVLPFMAQKGDKILIRTVADLGNQSLLSVIGLSGNRTYIVMRNNVVSIIGDKATAQQEKNNIEINIIDEFVNAPYALFQSLTTANYKGVFYSFILYREGQKISDLRPCIANGKQALFDIINQILITLEV